MRQITLPSSGNVYLDAAPAIYSVERHAEFWPLLLPVWDAAAQGRLVLISSELTLLETLVVLFKTNDVGLIAAYERALGASDLHLLPVTLPILRAAAKLRATARLKTPDALHLATALAANCTLFVTNDTDFRRVPNLPLVLLSDLL